MLKPAVSLSLEEFYNLVRSPTAHQNQMVSLIDSNGLQHFIDEDDYISYLGKIDQLLMDDTITIKVEKYEKEIDYNDGTVHIFYARKNSPSFDTHTDPIDIVLEVTHGVKTIEVNGVSTVIPQGICLFVPANTLHRATNEYESIMLSWGLHDST
jgi:mannose-6-phosphate isomerase-like protein (cupin superfamily)